MHYIFVYGTLLNGMERFRAIYGSAFIGAGFINGMMFDLGSFPGITDGGGTVFGEIYRIDDETLKILDRIEGYTARDEKGSLYLRREIKVTMISSGSAINAYTYVHNSSENRNMISSGDYRRYRMEAGADTGWYLAYGSNMHSERLRSRIGDVRDVKTGWLEGYRLVFNKRADNGGVFANIAYAGQGFMCPVAAYMIMFSQFADLDRCEGAPRHYMRISMPFVDISGNNGMGQVYVANPDRLTSEKIPSYDYYQHIHKGYREHGFDTGLLQQFY